MVDRVVLKASATSRIAESVETATKLADGRVVCHLVDDRGPRSRRAEIDSGLHDGMARATISISLALACPEHGHSMDELQPRDFSFNAPYGACPDCAGLGSREEVDPSLLIPDPSLSLNEGCIAPFRNGQLLPPGASRGVQHIWAKTRQLHGKICRRKRADVLYVWP